MLTECLGKGLLLLLFFTVRCPKGVNGYAAGAGAGACSGNSMMPGHGVDGQSVASPYTITASGSEYSAGGSITVTLAGSKAFKGFLVLALEESNSNAAPVGTFAVAQKADGTAVSQARCGGGTTHNTAFSSDPQSNLELIWTAPSPAVGNIKFYATFVEEKAKFWVKEMSSALIAESSGGGQTTGSPTTTATRGSGNEGDGGQTTGSPTSTAVTGSGENQPTTLATSSGPRVTANFLFGLVLFMAIVVAVCCQQVNGYPKGAPESACGSMTPSHGASAQTGDSPYSITAHATEYKAGDQVKVTLNGTQDFKGFLVLALSEDGSSSTVLGSFAVADGGDSSVIKPVCSGGATHTSNTGRNTLKLTWTAPAGTGNVKFYATFVQSKNTFWVKQPSAVVKATGDAVKGSNSAPLQMPMMALTLLGVAVSIIM